MIQPENPSVLLPQTLQRIGQDTVLAYLAQHGHPNVAWDHAVVEPLIQELYPAAAGNLQWDATYFDGGSPFTHRITKPIYRARVLGYTGIGLVSTSMAQSYHDQLQASRPGDLSHCEVIDSPVRVLELDILKRGSGNYQTTSFLDDDQAGGTGQSSHFHGTRPTTDSRGNA